MQSLCRGLRGGVQNHLTGSKFVCSNLPGSCSIRGVSGWITSEPSSDAIVGRSTASGSLPKCVSRSFVTLRSRLAFLSESSTSLNDGASSTSLSPRSLGSEMFKCGTAGPAISRRFITTMGQSEESSIASRIKFKRLDKTAKHIMQILDKEAVEGVRENKEIPDIKPGYLVQLKVEVPENKRRVSILKGIVIARRNAGLNTTFRIRRVVAGVGVESVFPLYSPNIKEMKVLDKKRVRRAKLYYLRDKINALKKL